MNSLIVAGAAPNSGNLGVNALCNSLVNGLYPLVSKTHEIKVLDFGTGIRRQAYQAGTNNSFDLVGANRSRRYYSQSTFANVEWQAKLNTAFTPTARVFKNSAVLDVSGGDSFTDLYGRERFELITYPKRIAQLYGQPLVLMPQTIGPFSDPGVREEAKRYLTYASLIYTRDARSMDYLRNLMGSEFDPNKCQQGVDMAFLLPTIDPPTDWVRDTKKHNRVGINVSGLIYNDPLQAKAQYGIKLDYRATMLELVTRLVQEFDVSVSLVPHVLVPKDNIESDARACEALREQLGPDVKERVEVLPDTLNETEVKGYIASFDWFAGMRMHATIAALSSAVPTVNFAYSGKALGVFETVEQGASVFDARNLNQDDLVSGALAHYQDKTVIRDRLHHRLKAVQSRAYAQMQDIAETIGVNNETRTVCS